MVPKPQPSSSQTLSVPISSHARYMWPPHCYMTVAWHFMSRSESITKAGWVVCTLYSILLYLRHGAHSANFDEKVHKPQSKSYGRIGANMQLIFTHILWIWILLSVHHNFLGSEGLQGTHIDALNPFSSKLMTLILRGGLWTFLWNLALCAALR